MRLADQVAMRPPITRLVLDHLIGQCVNILAGSYIIPVLNGPAQATSPPTQLIGIGCKVENMRSGTAHVDNGGSHCLFSCIVAEGQCSDQHKGSRIVLDRSPLYTDVSCQFDDSASV